MESGDRTNIDGTMRSNGSRMRSELSEVVWLSLTMQLTTGCCLPGRLGEDLRPCSLVNSRISKHRGQRKENRLTGKANWFNRPSSNDFPPNQSLERRRETEFAVLVDTSAYVLCFGYGCNRRDCGITLGRIPSEFRKQLAIRIEFAEYRVDSAKCLDKRRSQIWLVGNA